MESHTFWGVKKTSSQPSLFLTTAERVIVTFYRTVIQRCLWCSVIGPGQEVGVKATTLHKVVQVWYWKSTTTGTG